MRRPAWFACLLLLAVPDEGRPQSLGRLFFSPAERAAIDARQRSPRRPVVESSASFDGYMLRGAEGRTIWVNGVSRYLPGSAVRVAASAGRSGAASVAIDTGQAGVPDYLAVGERLDPSSGRARPLLEGGIVTVHR